MKTLPSPQPGENRAPLRPDWMAEVRACLYRYLRLSEAARAENDRIGQAQIGRDDAAGYLRNPHAKTREAREVDLAEREAYEDDFAAPAEVARESLLAAAFEAHGLSPRHSVLDRPLAVTVDGFIIAICEDSCDGIVPVLIQPSDVVAIRDIVPASGSSKKGRG